MHSKTFPTLLSLLCLSQAMVLAQEKAEPAIKWRGSVWVLGTTSDRATADGSAFLRPLESGDNNLSLDGLQLGFDVALSKEWSFKATFLGGQAGQIFQIVNGENDTIGVPEAMLIWSRGSETMKIGRMWTWIGTETLDPSSCIPATHGLMATFPPFFGQVGVEWRHAWNPSFSTAVWIYNGEDRNKDNNRGKTAGLGLIYNHAGSQDRFLNVMAFSGPEQDGIGYSDHNGAEGRKRERLSHNGQWVWGKATLAWEVEYLKEQFQNQDVSGADSDVSGKLLGFGTVFRFQWNPRWSSYLRAEQVNDNIGFRLGFDPTVAPRYPMTKGEYLTARSVTPGQGDENLGFRGYDPTIAPNYGMTMGADLTARSLSLGVERRWGSVFLRTELRRDSLNKPVLDQNGNLFRAVNSLNVCLGGSFSQ